MLTIKNNCVHNTTKIGSTKVGFGFREFFSWELEKMFSEKKFRELEHLKPKLFFA